MVKCRKCGGGHIWYVYPEAQAVRIEPSGSVLGEDSISIDRQVDHKRLDKLRHDQFETQSPRIQSGAARCDVKPHRSCIFHPTIPDVTHTERRAPRRSHHHDRRRRRRRCHCDVSGRTRASRIYARDTRVCVYMCAIHVSVRHVHHSPRAHTVTRVRDRAYTKYDW